MITSILTIFLRNLKISSPSRKVTNYHNIIVSRSFATNLKENPAIEEPSLYHSYVLRKKFKINYFKPEQWRVISSILDDRQDQYIVMPSAYGKSLCYQYPPVYSNSLAIVVSPLIALMEDQVLSLNKNDIPSCFIGHTQYNKKEVVNKLMKGHYRLLYITPESLMSKKGLELLHSIYKSNKINLIAIDEAHCVLQWGKDFRPIYGTLGMLRTYFPEIPILALTATASHREHENIISNLNLRNPQITYIPFECDNLYMDIKKMTKEPYGDIAEVLLEDTKNYNIEDGSVIIYCLTKKQTSKIASILNRMGMSCSAYHSGMSSSEKEVIFKDFLCNKIKIIVATTAFGMGINKPDIRVVIHYGTPLSIEGYCQEVGRAGRDGKPSLCVLIYSLLDFTTHRYLSNFYTNLNTIKLDKENRSNVMKKYVSTIFCRKRFISSYFNGFELTSNQRVDNFCCDNCSIQLPSSNRLKDFTRDAELILNTIRTLRPITLGVKSIISIIKGEHKKYTSNEFYGHGAHKSHEWWSNMIFLLEIENYIKIETKLVGKKLFSKLTFNIKGTNWLNDRDNGNIKLIILGTTKDLKFLKH